MQNEVYIDGVNVAECQYYFYEDTEKAHTCRLIQVDADLHYICKDNPDCYFKQLQRAKAENEELKRLNSVINHFSKGLKMVMEENEKLKAENEKLKEWLNNKEKAYNHLCDANNRKKEQIKNLNYMLFEEKDMTTQEWKLKYRLANKERKFIQYKEITNKRLNDYKQALEEVREWLLKWQFNANIIKHTNEPLNIINEVLNENM